MQLNSANAGSGQVLLASRWPGKRQLGGGGVVVRESKAFNSRTGGSGDRQMEGPTTNASQPAPAGPVMGYFYLLRLTVQAQGSKTVAAACGNWLMSHPVTALARWRLSLDSWSQMEEGWPQQGRAVCHPRLGRLGETMGTLKLRETRGLQRVGGGRGYRLEGSPLGGASQMPIHPKVHLGGLRVTDVQAYLSQLLRAQGDSAPSFKPSPPHPWSTSPFQSKAVPNTDSPKL